MQNESLAILRRGRESAERHPDIVAALPNNMGAHLRAQGVVDKGIEQHMKGNFGKALEHLTHALEIKTEASGRECGLVAVLLS